MDGQTDVGHINLIGGLCVKQEESARERALCQLTECF